MKIYLSPSMQVHNLYAAGNTNECAQCVRIAEAAEKALLRCGFQVKKAPQGQSAQDNVRESNQWGADLHVPIHTNAGGGGGALVLVYGENDMPAGQAVYDALRALVPGKPGYGVRLSPSLYELAYSKARALYLECEFHDSEELAEWIISHTTELGEAICRGICGVYGMAYLPPQGAWDTESKELSVGEEYAALCVSGASVEVSDPAAVAMVRAEPNYTARSGRTGDLYTFRGMRAGTAVVRACGKGVSGEFPVTVR